MSKLAFAATVLVDGDLESSRSLSVGNDFVVELSWEDFLDLLDRADGVPAVASASAVFDLDEVGCVLASDDLFRHSWL